MKKTGKETKETALREIKKLFLLAEKTKKPELAKRYVEIARKIGKRCNVKLPSSLRRKFCHKCGSFFAGKNYEVRLSKGKVSIRCLKCGSRMRFPFKTS